MKESNLFYSANNNQTPEFVDLELGIIPGTQNTSEELLSVTQTESVTSSNPKVDSNYEEFLLTVAKYAGYTESAAYALGVGAATGTTIGKELGSFPGIAIGIASAVTNCFFSKDIAISNQTFLKNAFSDNIENKDKVIAVCKLAVCLLIGAATSKFDLQAAEKGFDILGIPELAKKIVSPIIAVSATSIYGESIYNLFSNVYKNVKNGHLKKVVSEKEACKLASDIAFMTVASAIVGAKVYGVECELFKGENKGILDTVANIACGIALSSLGANSSIGVLNTINKAFNTNNYNQQIDLPQTIDLEAGGIEASSSNAQVQNQTSYLKDCLQKTAYGLALLFVGANATGNAVLVEGAISVAATGLYSAMVCGPAAISAVNEYFKSKQPSTSVQNPTSQSVATTLGGQDLV